MPLTLPLFHSMQHQQDFFCLSPTDSAMTESDFFKIRPYYNHKKHTPVPSKSRRGMRPLRSSTLSTAAQKNRKLRYYSSLPASKPAAVNSLHYLNGTITEIGTKKDLISLLPYEIASQIISHLDVVSLCSLATVSRSWFSISRSNDIWRRLASRWSLNIPQHIYPHQLDWYQLYKQRHILDSRWNNGHVATHYLIGHIDSVYCLQFDKQKIITGSRDRTIKFWDLSTYQCMQTLTGHEGSVLCLSYNEHIMVSGSSDTTLIVWNMKTFQPIMRLRGHSAGVLDVCFDDRFIISCSKDKTIRIWDINTGRLLRSILAHRGPVNAIQLEGNKLVSASGDALIKMWDITTGECLRKYAGHTRGLACVRYDGTKIVSGSNDKTIKVWDAESGNCLMSCEGHTDLVRTLSFDKDRIVSASYDQSIRVWDIKTGACLLNFQSGHTSWVFDVHFDSTRIVSASQDQRVLVMDFTTGLDTQFF
ncbi:WD40-repeat-containing domain protein [Parasitella parasitica]|nr:WD40-repeat-containing domain protein [Parasitella parasitica]